MTPLPLPLLLAVADDVRRLTPNLAWFLSGNTGFQTVPSGFVSTRVCPCPVAGRSLRASGPSLTARRLRFAIVARFSPRRSPAAQVANLCLPSAAVAQVANLCLPSVAVAQVANLCLPTSAPVAQVVNLCPPVVRRRPPSSPAVRREATARENHGGAS
jgi:hypothetical protein